MSLRAWQTLLCPFVAALALSASAGKAQAQSPVVSVTYQSTLGETIHGQRWWEGETRTFRITASPAPSADLTVNLFILASGGNIVAQSERGAKTVTVPTSGSATYTVATVDDEVVEEDSGLWVRVEPGTGYSPHATQGVSSVGILDDDTPVLSIAAAGRTTEGEAATFNLTASPEPSADLTVNVNLTQRGSFVAQSDLGAKTVTVPTSGSATYTVATADDDVDELAGYVILQSQDGTGYRRHWNRNSGTAWVFDNDDPSSDTPVVRITGSPAIAEGDTAIFTATASPAPTADLTINLSTWQAGSFAASSDLGSKTVTVPTSGSATFTVATVDDEIDEKGGYLGVQLPQGEGYGVHNTLWVATITVNDNDDPSPGTPVVSITAGGTVTEGTDATFTVTASPAPTADLAVALSVSGSDRFLPPAERGPQFVTVPTSGSATYTVATVDDDVDEAGGGVRLSAVAREGYSLDNLNWEASVRVNDNDDPSPDTPVVSITAGETVTEGTDATFTVTASPAPTADLAVALSVSGSDRYLEPAEWGPQFVTVPTSGSATYTVATVDDNVYEAGGRVTLRAVGALARESYRLHNLNWEASVTVNDNDDPPPSTPVVPPVTPPPPDQTPGSGTQAPGGSQQQPRKPDPLQLALWTDQPAYRAGETVRLYHSLDPHDDRGQYRTFVYLERAAGGERRYLAPLSAAGELRDDPVDRHGMPAHLARARTLAPADRSLSWQGQAPAPGLWQFVLELRPGSADEQSEKPSEPLLARRAWARFAVAERSQLLNRRGFDRELREDLTLRSDTIHYLGHQLFVRDGATLTIEPGTLVRAWGQHAAIIVEPGGRIVAEGTRQAPVVLTCSVPVGWREPGCWGGLRILGRAPSTRPDAVAPGVLPPERPAYGGSDAAESGGVLRYVRVEFAGAGSEQAAPVPAVGLYGAGSGTVLDHVQAHASLGHGFAFRGGAAVCHHCVASGSGEAGLAWDRGWRGGASHLFVLHGRGGGDGLSGGHDSEGHDREPRSLPILSNLTLIHASPYDRRARRAVALRLSDGSGVSAVDLLATGFGGGAVRAVGRSRQLFGEGEGSVSGALLYLNGSPQLRGGIADAVEFSARDPKLRDVRDFPNPDPRPKADSPALSREREGYIGAFGRKENWLEGWTVFGPESAYDLRNAEGSP